MTTVARALALTLGLAVCGAPALAGGSIAGACEASGAASKSLCDCLQHVADQTLDGGDQRKAAKLFRDPDKAEELRMADSGSAEEFWQRYTNFAATAEAYCAVQ